jgi:site-specific DNA-methyltransferase (adenine-specific)
MWRDPTGRHSVGCIDSCSLEDVRRLLDGKQPALAVQDPPYNLIAFDQKSLHEYIAWSKAWLDVLDSVLSANASLYIWIGADQNAGFQPLPDLMILMRGTSFRPRSFITMRNQRGYGTQKNWMAVRQELLYYVRGNPYFDAAAEYTDIPKILRGYYKEVNGRTTENLERSRSSFIRAGNVWVDVQQVFYRLEENVNGCYAQKPFKAYQRIISASSSIGDAVVDLFAHSGTTLLACEILNRVCVVADVDPVFCEIAIRRLERFRSCGKLGWQNGNPFEREIESDPKLRVLARSSAAEAESAQLALPGAIDTCKRNVLV